MVKTKDKLSMFSHKRNQDAALPSFCYFGYEKIWKIQFLPKVAKVANNKSFLFLLKMFIKDIQNGDKGCMCSHNEIRDVVLPIFWYLAYEK